MNKQQSIEKFNASISDRTAKALIIVAHNLTTGNLQNK